jgi:hypothetical protein
MKRALLIAFALAVGAVRLPAQLPAWSDEAQKAWWVANPTLKQQVLAANGLKRSLDLDYQKNGSAVFSQPDFQGWLDLYAWVKLGIDSGDVLAKADNFDSFVALGSDSRISRLMAEKIEPDDKEPAALEILIHLAQANMADLHEYAALGVAYALVFDVPFPDDWPHAQVAQSAVPIGDTDPVARFQFYVAANRARKLELDLSLQTFENLRFLVDSEVSLSELEWAQQNTTTIPYTHFVDAFFSINYATMRVGSGNDVYNWNLKTYRLSDIKSVGGICVDQAYYAYMAGKARGIPTIFFTGQGDAGGHAWFGYLDRSGAWQLDCGRYEQQNYAKGYTRDPQTWEELKDTDLEQMVKNGVNDSSYPAARAALDWARLQGDTPLAKTAYEDARTIMPNLAEAWRAEADYLDRTNASVDDLKTFYQAWISQISPYADQKVAAQRRLVGELRKAGDPSADSVEQDIILQNRSGGVDLAVQGTADAIDDHMNAHDWDGARMEYERSVRDFADNGGGTFFYRLVEPYWRECLTHGQVEQAGNGIRFTDDRTKLDQPDWNGPTTISAEFDDMKKKQTGIEAGLAAMQTWLQEIDSGQADQAWSDAGAAFQGQSTSDQWSSTLSAARGKAGNVTSRALTMIGYHDHWPSADGRLLNGPFVTAKFTATGDSGSFDENVIFQKTGRDTWQAYSYEAKPVAVPAAAAAAP